MFLWLSEGSEPKGACKRSPLQSLCINYIMLLFLLHNFVRLIIGYNKLN